MSSVIGECYIALQPYTENKAIIYGRNSIASLSQVQEVVYFPATKNCEKAKCDGGVNIERNSTLSVILCRPISSWGGESGSNERNVSVGILWSQEEPQKNSLKSLDYVRLALEKSSTSEAALSEITNLVSQYASDLSKFSFIICDPNEVWLLSVSGKCWAAEHIDSGFRKIPTSGLAVQTKIDKKCDKLDDILKEMDLWDSNEDLNFAKAFSAEPTVDFKTELSTDGIIDVRKMFEFLRNSDQSEKCFGSHVTSLTSNGISCHWFTGTPNVCESVFKPFIFSSNSKISPLTKAINGDEDITLLYKLHKERNWENVGDLLKSLEATCVDEVNKFLVDHPTSPDHELDDLMKDCVEAEVKFYR